MNAMAFALVLPVAGGREQGAQQVKDGRVGELDPERGNVNDCALDEVLRRHGSSRWLARVEQLLGYERFRRWRSNGLATQNEQQSSARYPTPTHQFSNHHEPVSTHRKLVALRGSPAPLYSATFGYAQSSLEPLGLASESSQWASISSGAASASTHASI